MSLPRCGADWIRREEVEAIGSRDDYDDDAKIPAALGFRTIGLETGSPVAENGLAGGLLGFSVF